MALIITVAALVVAACCGVIAWRAARIERSRSEARVAALSAVIDPPRQSDPPPLFATATDSISRRHPLLEIGVFFASVVALIVVVAMTNDLYEDSATAAAAEQREPPLALLSMHHEQDTDNTLTITGLVRNEGRMQVEGITAVVFAFDKAGGFITSGRAALDLNVLAPGENASFRVMIPRLADVGRYRVSFRTDAGLVRHMDRRAQRSQRPGPATTASSDDAGR